MESVFNTDALISKYIPKEEIEQFKSYIPKNVQINESNVRLLANMYLSLKKQEVYELWEKLPAALKNQDNKLEVLRQLGLL